jgi:transposase InsO family protein
VEQLGSEMQGTAFPDKNKLKAGNERNWLAACSSSLMFIGASDLLAQALPDRPAGATPTSSGSESAAQSAAAAAAQAELNDWKKLKEIDHRARGIIMASVHSDMLYLIQDEYGAELTSAHAMWTELTAHVKRTLGARQDSSREQLSVIKQNTGEPVLAYFSRAHSLWADINQVSLREEKIAQVSLLKRIVRGLHDDLYKDLKSYWEEKVVDDKLTYAELVSKVTAREDVLKVEGKIKNKQQPSNSAFATVADEGSHEEWEPSHAYLGAGRGAMMLGRGGRGRGRGAGGRGGSLTCYKCGESGHVSRMCTTICTRCGNDGHRAERCKLNNSPQPQQQAPAPTRGYASFAAVTLEGASGQEVGRLVASAATEQPLPGELATPGATVTKPLPWQETVDESQGSIMAACRAGADDPLCDSFLALAEAGEKHGFESAEGRAALKEVVRALDSGALLAYDREDWMLKTELFQELSDSHGPFDLDAAAAIDGSNAQLPEYCSKADSFLMRDVAGLNVYCNPPFRRAKQFLDHYLRCKSSDPAGTSAVFILPHQPDADWWPLLQSSGMEIVKVWPKDTRLFTMPGKLVPSERRELRPCHFEVIAVYDPPQPRAYHAAAAAHSLRLVLDSGATQHITPDSSQLIDYRPYAGPTIMGANGQPLEPLGEGELQLRSYAGETPITYTLRRVVHSPSAPCTLVSMCVLMDAGLNPVVDEGDGSVRLSPSGEPSRTVFKLARVGNLLEFDDIAVLPVETAHGEQAALARSGPAAGAEEWHRRLGHVGFGRLAELTECVDGMTVSKQRILQHQRQRSPCADCQVGKQTREPRPPVAGKHAERKLGRVHFDLVGPLPPSLMGNRYVLTVVDEFTRYSTVRFMVDKGSASSHLQQAVRELEAATGEKLWLARSDRGREFYNASMDAFYRRRGAIAEPTVGYSPESNGMAERVQRVLVDMSRTLLLAAGLPDAFWAEAMAHANDVRNVTARSPAAGTPFEAMHGRRPDLSRLREFGSLAWTSIPWARREGKLAPVAEACVLLGGGVDTRLSRVYIDDQVRIVRDLTVDTTCMGYARLHGDHAAAPSHDEWWHESGEQAPDRGGGPSPTASDDSDQPQLQRGHDNFSSDDEASPEQQEPASEGESRPQHGYSLRSLGRMALGAARAAVYVPVPQSVAEADSGPHAEEWKAARDRELSQLVGMQTWVLVPRPKGKTVLTSKWLFKPKLGADGSVERFKARLVAGGHRQRPGWDYDERGLYAPVASLVTLRMLLALTAVHDLEMESVDISNAFLNGRLKEEVYMEQPEGFVQGGPDMVCKLQRTLYGLKQAPKEWYDELSSGLVALGFELSTSDSSLWRREGAAGPVFILHWVDDLLLVGADAGELAALKRDILARFPGRDLGAASRYLGIDIVRDRAARTLTISQPAHVASLLEQAGMANCRVGRLPMSTTADCTAARGDDCLMEDPHHYASAVGVLLYLACVTRPDITTAVSMLSRHTARPTERHWSLVLALLRYLQGTSGLGITYGAPWAQQGMSASPASMELQAWSDADWGACQDTRRSRTGYVFRFCGGAVSWSSQMQPVVAGSTAEAEYVAAAAGAREATWLRRLARDLGVHQEGPLPMGVDNQAALVISSPVGAHRPKTKHIALRYHFLRECVTHQRVGLYHCPTAENPADMLTKPLSLDKIALFREMLGMKVVEG